MELNRTIQFVVEELLGRSEGIAAHESTIEITNHRGRLPKPCISIKA